jgi:hypothetical protein
MHFAVVLPKITPEVLKTIETLEVIFKKTKRQGKNSHLLNTFMAFATHVTNPGWTLARAYAGLNISGPCCELAQFVQGDTLTPAAWTALEVLGGKPEESMLGAFVAFSQNIEGPPPFKP